MDPDKLRKIGSPDMYGLGNWNPVMHAEMFSFLGRLVWKIFFDDYHFTISPNASPLIVRSS
jgi:hypothetical protein